MNPKKKNDMKKILIASLTLAFMFASCSPLSATPIAQATITVAPPTDIPTLAPVTETFTPVPPTVTPTSTLTAIPLVESLKATVTADLLSCRYGPGAEYLYLYGLKKGANIQLMGRTDGNNWVMVAGKNKCWVNANFLEVAGDPQTLQIMYPDGYKLPVSPYYSAAAILSAVRDANKVTVNWTDITLRAGDEEDENMFIYVIEVWRCEGGKIIFDPLASNFPEVTFVDEAGCNVPSHGRVFFQEKHGFAGPAEIPWPTQQ
jgi:uncharacterized protein YraI